MVQVEIKGDLEISLKIKYERETNNNYQKFLKGKMNGKLILM